ncbi:valine--tRNA ligase [Nesterenkonia pannonica]|uniref:valine--tRNA ligase n=1 Tax=Nesterenkonia pannonica TaxID=1548602 RepID=UPI0021649454|nr:valine--tRNA ligase [Nesterenkonia pannonica]
MSDESLGTDSPITPAVPEKPALEGLEATLNEAWQAERLYHFDETAPASRSTPSIPRRRRPRGPSTWAICSPTLRPMWLPASSG